jgi:uncharacterized protein
MIYPAFLLGFLGSVHCVAMCGPLAIVFAPRKNQIVSRLLQNSGRISTYVALGAVLGGIGQQFDFFKLQQTLSLTMGILLLVFALSTLVQKKASFLVHSKVISKLNKWFNPLEYNGMLRYFLFGMVNGLLPCGLTYMALASALTFADVAQSASFMFFFGLGTLPSMYLVGRYGKYLVDKFIVIQKYVMPSIVYIVAFVLIIRGLGLGIPYLSPEETKTGEVKCCHKK